MEGHQSFGDCAFADLDGDLLLLSKETHPEQLSGDVQRHLPNRRGEEAVLVS